MKLSLSTRWFLWLSLAVGLFCVGQVAGMVWLEVLELAHGEGSFKQELAEIAVLMSVSGGVFVLMLGGFWFVSKRMIRPIRDMAESAHRISEGSLKERVEDTGSADEIGMLASALNLAFDKYQEVFRRLEQFAGNAAHQLRTPLASIRSIGEVCLQREREPEEYQQCIGEMLEVTQELTGIVEKLLMIARLNPSRVRQQFTRVCLADVLTRVLAVYDVMLEEKNIELKMGELPPQGVLGDGDLIGQAIGNVVENAARYTPEGGTVTITLLHEDDRVALRVCDTGPGVPDAMCVASETGKDTRWNGELPTGRLGLAVVAEIMRIHNGSLDLRAQPQGGTCVELLWPTPGSSRVS